MPFSPRLQKPRGREDASRLPYEHGASPQVNENALRVTSTSTLVGLVGDGTAAPALSHWKQDSLPDVRLVSTSRAGCVALIEQLRIAERAFTREHQSVLRALDDEVALLQGLVINRACYDEVAVLPGQNASSANATAEHSHVWERYSRSDNYAGENSRAPHGTGHDYDQAALSNAIVGLEVAVMRDATQKAGAAGTALPIGVLQSPGDLSPPSSARPADAADQLPTSGVPLQTGPVESADESRTADSAAEVIPESPKTEADEVGLERHRTNADVLLDVFVTMLPEHGLGMLVPMVRSCLECARWALSVEEPPRTGVLARFVANRYFQMLCLTVIISNAGFGAYVADYEVQHLGADGTTFMKRMEIGYLIFYSCELILKLVVHGFFFFWNEDFRWNIFDLVLVVFAMYEQLMELLLSGSRGNLVFMRIFRVLKISKLGRLVRVLRFFRELRLMLMSIKASMTSLFWALCMIAFIVYIVGLVLLQGLTGMLLDGTADPDLEESVKLHFGSVTDTVVSLYKAGTGGEDWGVYYRIVEPSGILYSYLFLLYVAFFTVSVMNILTGIVVENVVSVAKSDKEKLVHDYQVRCKDEIRDMKMLFKALDTDGNDTINAEEWEQGAASPQVQALMAANELDMKDATMFFDQLLNITGTEDVDVDSFVDGCLKMKGSASSLDLQLVSFVVRDLRKTLMELKGDLASKLHLQHGVKQAHHHLNVSESGNSALTHGLAIAFS